MRVAGNMIYNRQLFDINRNMKTISSLHQQAATAKQIQFPSENPIGATRAIKYRNLIDSTMQYERNIGPAINWMEVTDEYVATVRHIKADSLDALRRAY